MGYDLERSHAAEVPAAAPDLAVFGQALSRNLFGQRFAIHAYRKIAEGGQHYDKATLRLVKVALTVQEEQAEILTAIIENLRNTNGALAG
jgi:hypothetical protein